MSAIRTARTLLTTAILLTAGLAGTAAAQGVEARVLEFRPAAGGAVSRYDLEIAVAGTTQLLQRVPLGVPAADVDGLIRVDVARQLTVAPAAGATYTARVLAVRPAGTTVSVASNPFRFRRCTVAASAPAMMAAAGGDATLTVTASGPSCGWTATSGAAWLTVSRGTTGTGAGSLTVSATANPAAEARTAHLTIGGTVVALTQAGAAAQTIAVASEPALQAAMAALTSHTTIVLAAGTYRLTAPLVIDGAFTGVTLRGATGDAADVIIEGAGMTGPAMTALTVRGDVAGLQIADLSIRRLAGHALAFEAGVTAPILRDLRLTDTGAALIAVHGATDGLLQGSWLGYTTTGATAAAGGLDLRGAARWTVTGTAFRRIQAPAGAVAHAAVSASAGSTDTVVSQNLFVDCQRALAFGLTDRADGTDHRGGRIANNFIARAAGIGGGAAIALVDSPDTAVVHNTVMAAAAVAIEIRVADTTHVTLTNNLTDGALVARDGAWALETGNTVDATADLFVNVAAGDLHLAAAAVVPAGVPSADATDIDGQPRATDSTPGADAVLARN